ncbi:DUF1428 domain-containing protein [Pseudooceanicola sp.]|uniref:DUF1428 domain-containing protein n=1 Tax=Pseudooceanicola sp. TaxID=1914328 RepID=UPI004058012A
MSYVNGFVLAVPAANKDAYIAAARRTWPLFQEYGALSTVEAWGDNVPEGEHTSFPMAVKLEEGEVVVFSWIIWKDREAADRCMASSETDPRWAEMMDMPFDGKRMIWGGFTPIFEA